MYRKKKQKNTRIEKRIIETKNTKKNFGKRQKIQKDHKTKQTKRYPKDREIKNRETKKQTTKKKQDNQEDQKT